MSKPPHLTILGAGVCGLYAALTALRKGAKVTIIEKNTHPGGLAAGFKRGPNFFDQGVHMLHATDQEIYHDIARLMADERLPVTLDARIRWNGRSYRYPLKGLDILAGMNPTQLIRCSLGLLTAEIKNRLNHTQASAITAEDALIATYGSPLYEFFFKEFTHKYWSIHPAELSAEFVRRKMPRLNALDLVKKCLPRFKSKQSPDLVVESALAEETLHYSATGSETLPRVLAREVESLGGTIIYGATITQINGTEIHLTNQILPTDKILSTIPLPLLVDLHPTAPAPVKEAARNLHYKPIATYGLLVRKPKCLESLYTYYRDRIFHRVGDPKNAGLNVRPDDHSVLIVEMTCNEDDSKWNDAPEVRQQVIDDLAAEDICQPQEIIEWHHFTNPHGYPIYRLNFDNHLETINQWLHSRKHLLSTGRQGSFSYPGMHNAMRMGEVSANELLT
ncbi:MAG: protoporphyrinogen/coproporphyrinogen oxidase [Verrucomicrobiaceae bacterium]